MLTPRKQGASWWGGERKGRGKADREAGRQATAGGILIHIAKETFEVVPQKQVT